MNNQSHMARVMLSDLNTDDPHYYSFDRNCNSVEDPLGRICVSKKTKDVNLKVFNMIKGINESKN